jgi:hypothetical protein
LRDARRGVQDLRQDLVELLADPGDLDPDQIAALRAMKERADANLLRLMDIEPSHGPVNHVTVSDDGLMNRVSRGINPRYGNPQSGPSRATRMDPEAWLDASDQVRIRTTPEGASTLDGMAPSMRDLIEPAFDEAIEQGQSFFRVSDVPLEDLLGPDWATKVDGFVKVGSGNPNPRAAPMGAGDFSGTATVQYNLVDGQWEMSSLYPNHSGGPRPGTMGGPPTPADAMEFIDGAWQPVTSP